MSSTNSSSLRLTKLRKKYLAEYIRLTDYKITGRDWDYKLWEFMHERDNNIAQHDVKRWIAAHKYMLVPGGDEIHDEVATSNVAMKEHTTDQPGQAQTNHDNEQHRDRTVPINSAVSTSTATGLRILNTFQLAPAPAPSPRDLGGTSGSSSSSFTTEENASYFPSVAGSAANDEDLDLQCRDMQAIKNIYQSAFDAIEVIHEACMKLPEVKTCLIPLEEISKKFHRNHHKFIFPVRYQAARNSNGRVKVEAFANNDVYHHDAQDADEEMQDLEASPTYAGAENADMENETSSADQTDERTGAGYSMVESVDEDQNEPVYCFCSGVAYGQMIACDNPRCPIEWFHPGCVNLSNIPQGDWFCPQCSGNSV